MNYKAIWATLRDPPFKKKKDYIKVFTHLAYASLETQGPQQLGQPHQL